MACHLHLVRELLTRYLPTWDKVPSLRGGHGLSPAFLRVDCPGSYIEASRLYGFPISSQVFFSFFSSLHLSDQPVKSAEISFLVRLWSVFEICWSFLSGSSQVISLCYLPEHFRSSFCELLPAPAAKPSATNSFFSWRLLSGSPQISLRGMLDFLSSSFFFFPLLHNASWQHPLL